MTDDAARFGDPRLPSETITSKSHLFHLGALAPTTYDGGIQQQAHEDNFPILKGQQASIQLITLQPGGIRGAPLASQRVGDQPGHQRRSRPGSSSTGTATTRVSDAHVDDPVFAPQGSFHYFENRGTGNLEVLIIQNTSAPEDKDNIGVG